MYRYRCYFEIAVSKSRRVVYADELYLLKDGFWVNSEMTFTQASDCKYFIPASNILYIEKVKGEE